MVFPYKTGSVGFVWETGTFTVWLTCPITPTVRLKIVLSLMKFTLYWLSPLLLTVVWFITLPLLSFTVTSGSLSPERASGCSKLIFKVISGSTIVSEFELVVLFPSPSASSESAADTAPHRASTKTIVVTNKIACFLNFSPTFCFLGQIDLIQLCLIIIKMNLNINISTVIEKNSIKLYRIKRPHECLTIPTATKDTYRARNPHYFSKCANKWLNTK